MNKKNHSYLTIYFLYDSEGESLPSDISAQKNKSSSRKFTGILPSEQELLNQHRRGEDPYLKFLTSAGLRAKQALEQNQNLYIEVHHIKPLHDGGSDEPENMIQLLYNDHVIAHYILSVLNPEKRKIY